MEHLIKNLQKGFHLPCNLDEGIKRAVEVFRPRKYNQNQLKEFLKTSQYSQDFQRLLTVYRLIVNHCRIAPLYHASNENMQFKPR